MASIKVSFLGKFNIACGERKTSIVRARKVQELFVYLLIFRNHPQPRERLSEILWADQPATISKKNLRQTLWHLQSGLQEIKNSSRPSLLVDNEWIQVGLPTDFWLDVAEFEKIFDKVNNKRARELSTENFEAMQYAVNLYKGDLLEGWYQDWCIFERERFQMMQMTLLDKLIQYCEIHQQYDAGLAYCWRVLRYDQTYERAHRQMMRLYFMSGHRTQALHQYDRCIAALRGELGVEPSERTKMLYEQIRLDMFKPSLFTTQKDTSWLNEANPPIAEVLTRLEQFSVTLRSIEAQIHQEIMILESMLSDQG